MNRPRTVKPIAGYFKEAVKFYDLENPMVARVIFILELAVLFGGYMQARPYIYDLYTHYEQLLVRMDGELSLESLNKILLTSGAYEAMARSILQVFLIVTAIRSVAFLISLFFGSWYFFDLTDPQMTGAQRTSVFFSRLPKIILFNILFYIVFYVGITALLIVFVVVSMIIPILSIFTALMPLFIMCIHNLFVFKDLLIIEFDVGIFRNFGKTLALTRNNKKTIILNMLSVSAIGWLLGLFSIDLSNAVLSLFITVFLECIILLVTQRMSVLMFLDAASLERKDGKEARDQADV